jgi:hypothetical protein
MAAPITGPPSRSSFLTGFCHSACSWEKAGNNAVNRANKVLGFTMGTLRIKGARGSATAPCGAYFFLAGALAGLGFDAGLLLQAIQFLLRSVFDL